MIRQIQVLLLMVQGLLAFLPVITIGLLFGLAIDYELFLMTRVHEEYSKVVNPRVAINDKTNPSTAFNGTRIDLNTIISKIISICQKN
jgi:uncharacterized membrane protein YdfJ with MMPL/SSD domain